MKYKIGEHVLFTHNKNAILYNSIITGDDYIKGIGFCYQVTYQEKLRDHVIKKTKNKNTIDSQGSVRKTWYVYENQYGKNINLPFIQRKRLWKKLS